MDKHVRNRALGFGYKMINDAVDRNALPAFLLAQAHDNPHAYHVIGVARTDKRQLRDILQSLLVDLDKQLRGHPEG